MSTSRAKTEVNMSELSEGFTDLADTMAELAESDQGYPFAMVLIAVDRASRANPATGKFSGDSFFDHLERVAREFQIGDLDLTWEDRG